jgi:hypothetical protein
MIVETLVALFVLGVAIGLLAMILLPLPFLRVEPSLPPRAVTENRGA